MWRINECDSGGAWIKIGTNEQVGTWNSGIAFWGDGCAKDGLSGICTNIGVYSE